MNPHYAKQKLMVNTLAKYCPKYFLYKRTSQKEYAKVRIRNDRRREEQAPEDDRTERVTRRLKDMKNGWLTPCSETYKPVGGWPTLELDDLVYKTMADQLDPQIKPAVVKHFPAKPEMCRKRESIGKFKEACDPYAYQSAGMSKIRAHIRSSEKSIPMVYAGKSYQRTLLRGPEQSEPALIVPKKEEILEYKSEEKLLGEERFRRDEIKYLETIDQLIKTLMMIKVRHLKSTEPIRLDYLGSEQDLEEEKRYLRKQRLQCRPGLPPKLPNFREQIVIDAPPWWNPSLPSTQNAQQSVSDRMSRRPATGSPSVSKSVSGIIRPVSSQTLRPLQSDTLPSSGRNDTLRRQSSMSQLQNSNTTVDKEEVKQSVKDFDLFLLCRKPWPPVWMSLAAAEQRAMAEALLPTYKATACTKGHGKSVDSLLVERKKWADVRKKAHSKAEKELKRKDIERVEFFHLKLDTLKCMPISRTFEMQERIMRDVTMESRRERQRYLLYDCEITGWYRTLEEEEWVKMGEEDEEVNARLDLIKHHFRLAPKKPIFVRARMALMVMSMPATEICHIHVQRALQFLLEKVLRMPSETLGQWLATRGLPMVLVKDTVKDRAWV